jgi:integrase
MPSIRKRGSRYHVQIRKKGYPPITKSFSSLRLAKTFAKDAESKIERGVFRDTTLAETTTFLELAERYEREILPTKKGFKIELYNIKPLKRALGTYMLKEITPFLISRHRDSRLKEVKPATAKRELGLLSRILSAGEKDFGIHLPHGNPVRLVRIPSEPPGRDRRPTVAELDLLYADCTVGGLVKFAVETGMRRGEIASMDWGHINWDTSTLGFTLTSRTHQKRPIMAVEVCHAEAKKILPGVQTGGC